MSLRLRAAWLLCAALLAPLTNPLTAQDNRLQATSTSEPAKKALRAALYESQNLRAEKAREHAAQAVAADPQLGLAKVYQALVATGTPAARTAAIAQNLGAMGSASPAEVLLALYWREAAAGRGPAAVSILKTAMELVPADAEVAYVYHNTQLGGKSPAEQAAVTRAFLQRFPAHAAAHNQLAYTLWRTGDGEGALAAVQQYAKYAPEHPNAHDSYADILLLLRRSAEALPHVQREIELDSTFAGAYTKLGSIHLTMGNVREARTAFATAAARATTPAQRIDAGYWQAAAQIHDGNGRAALQDLDRVGETARGADMTGALALAHNRSAVVDAYMGDRKAVATHLAAAAAAASNPNQKAGQQFHAAIALSRIGKTQEARAAASQFAGSENVDPIASNSLDAILALDAKDYAAAEAAIGKLTEPDVLSTALRAELMVRTGRKAEGQALRQEVLSSSVKLDGNPPINFMSLVGRMRVAKL